MLTFLVSVLVVARYFLPAESASLGETLWIVQFWLIAGVLWQWMSARNGVPRRSIDALDVGVGLLVMGHVLSAIAVLMTDGDKRAALNMLWEWVGIGMATAMIRAVISQPDGLGRLRSVVVMSAITLSGLGLWQHHVWYPQISDKLAELDRWQAEEPADQGAAVVRQKTIQQLQSELGLLGSTENRAANQLLRSRIAASTEPIGRFALANTFAGLLLVGLLLAVDRLLSRVDDEEMPSGSRRRLVVGILAVLVVAYSFWLTKSRTAGVALMVALSVWGILLWRSKRVGRGTRWAVGLLAALLVGLPVIASLSGGLDREVITEAPKSLQYRLEYWTATGQVIREHPLRGVGPGNFRQAYLRHKLPGSSEEILDPHNLFLDVWANGGLLALAGLVWVLITMGRRLLSTRSPASTEGSSTEETHVEQDAADARNNTHSRWTSFYWRCGVGLTALAIAAFVELINGGGFSDGGWWLAGGWCLVSLLWSAKTPATIDNGRGRLVFGIAAMGLIVHLMGAGGIGMPAILQTLIILAAATIGPLPAEPTTNMSADASPWRPMLAASLCLCLAIACAFSSTLPVSACRTQTQLGQVLLSVDGNIPGAERSFRRAIEADPLAAEPWRELALTILSDWMRLAGTDDMAFERAVAAQEEAIRHDPHSATGWRSLGQLWWRHFVTQRDRKSAESAQVAFQQAAERYPHLATLQAELAQAANAAGVATVAQSSAQRALELDDLNRRLGHVDKYVPDSVRESMSRLASGENR